MAKYHMGEADLNKIIGKVFAIEGGDIPKEIKSDMYKIYTSIELIRKTFSDLQNLTIYIIIQIFVCLYLI